MNIDEICHEMFIFQSMISLYRDCHLIHADLSEYNILWFNSKCYFIDVSQSVEPIHPEGLEFLYRDCTNICTVMGHILNHLYCFMDGQFKRVLNFQFFTKKGVENVKSAADIFHIITGLNVDGTECEILRQVTI